MKRSFLNLLFSMLLITSSGSMYLLHGQEGQATTKTGWKIGGLLPTITFDSDLGFQYGALLNLYNYGDGSRYPKYNHSLYFEVSRFTKGSGYNRFFYDSDQLLKGIRTTFDLSYITDPKYDFYGFNGYEVTYRSDFTDTESEDYISRAYYAHDRKMFRTKLDLQGRLSGEKLRWVSGFELYNFKVGSVDLDKLNKGKDEEDQLPDVPGLPRVAETAGSPLGRHEVAGGQGQAARESQGAHGLLLLEPADGLLDGRTALLRPDRRLPGPPQLRAPVPWPLGLQPGGIGSRVRPGQVDLADDPLREGLEIGVPGGPGSRDGQERQDDAQAGEPPQCAARGEPVAHLLTLPVFHHHAHADAVREVVVVDEALAVAHEVLDVAVEVLDQGEAHLELRGAAVVVEAQVVAEHERQVEIPPDRAQPDLPVTQVGLDVRVVVLLCALGDAQPGLDLEVQDVPLEAEVGHDAVPAAREGLAAAVGLVVEADLDEPAPHQAEDVRVGAVVEQGLRFVIRLAEGGGELGVVKLPERQLRVGEPEIQGQPEDVLPELHLEADLELDLGVIELRARVGRLEGLLLLVEVVRVGQDVVVPVGHDGVAP